MPTAPDPVEVIARALPDLDLERDLIAADVLAALEAAGLSDPALRAELEAERAETAKLRHAVEAALDKLQSGKYLDAEAILEAAGEKP